MSDTEKRIFPRSDMQCPVLYHYGDNQTWKVGKMLNFSATGMLLLINEEPGEENIINIHVKPGSKKVIPEITATGEIIRVDKTHDEFILACRLTNVARG